MPLLVDEIRRIEVENANMRAALREIEAHYVDRLYWAVDSPEADSLLRIVREALKGA